MLYPIWPSASKLIVDNILFYKNAQTFLGQSAVTGSRYISAITLLHLIFDCQLPRILRKKVPSQQSRYTKEKLRVDAVTVESTVAGSSA